MSKEQGETGNVRKWQIDAGYPFGWHPADDQSLPNIEYDNEETDWWGASDFQMVANRIWNVNKQTIVSPGADLDARFESLSKALSVLSNTKYIIPLRDALIDICQSTIGEDTATPSPLAILDEALVTALLVADSHVMSSRAAYAGQIGYSIYLRLKALPKSVNRDEALSSLMLTLTDRASWDDSLKNRGLTADRLLKERLMLAIDLPSPSRAFRFFLAYDDIGRSFTMLTDDFVKSLPVARTACELVSATVPEDEHDIYRTCMWSIQQHMARVGFWISHDSIVALNKAFHDILELVIRSADDLRGDLGVAYNCYTSYLDALVAWGEFTLAASSIEKHVEFFTEVMDALRQELDGSPASNGFPPSDLPLLLEIARSFSKREKAN